jgi:DNA-binding CsgD family transcriptional regulator
VIMRRGGRAAGVMFLCREPGSRDFDPREREAMLRIRPHLLHAMGPSPVTAPMVLPEPIADEDFGPTDDSASLLVAASGEIELASQRAWSLLVEFADEGIRAGQPILRFKECIPPALRVLIDRLAAIEAGILTLPPSLTRRTQSGAIMARAYPLQSPGAGHNDGRIVMVLEARRPRQIHVLRSLAGFDFSPAERKAAFEMAMGSAPGDACSRLGIRASTWRDYTKRVYRRMAVSGRPEFLRRLH